MPKALESASHNPKQKTTPRIVVFTQALSPALVCPLLLLRGQGREIAVYCRNGTRKPSYDHDFTWRILSNLSGVKLIAPAEFGFEPQDTVLLGLSHWLDYDQNELSFFFDRLPKNTPFSIIYASSYGNYWSRLRAQCKSAFRHLRLLRANRIIFTGDPRRPDLFGIGRNRIDFIPTPSTDFLITPDGLNAMPIQPSPEIRRPNRFCFSGANHRVRMKIEEACRDLFGLKDRIEMNRRLESFAYLEELASADFSLCLPGGLIWSHRMTESVIMGAIPILGREAYSFLSVVVPEDAVVLVQSDYCPLAWRKSLQQAAALTPDEIMAKRRKLHALREGDGPLSLGRIHNTFLSPFGLAR